MKKINRALKVVIITSYPFPDFAATANRVSTLAKEIALESNFDVVVVGPGPREALEGPITQETKNYSVISVCNPTFCQTRLFLRAFGELKQTRRLLKAAQDENADLYIASIPSIFLMLAAIFFRTKPIIFDFRDLVWEYLINLGGTRSIAGRAMKVLAPSLLKHAIAITVTNLPEKRLLSQMTEVPITIVGNGISQERFSRLKLLRPPLQGVPFRVLYIGNLGEAQNLETLLEAIGGDEQFEINLVGDGNRVNFLKDLVCQGDMTNVKFIGALQWSDTLAYIEKANCLYGQISTAFNSAVPSKLYEYLSSGRPVVFGLADGAAKNLVSDFEGVTICNPDTPSELREKLLELKRDTATKASSIQSNRNRIQQHHLRENGAKSLVELMKFFAAGDAGRH